MKIDRIIHTNITSLLPPLSKLSRFKCLSILAAALGLACTASAQGLLLSDNFDGSQTGSLAPVSWNLYGNATISTGSLNLPDYSSAPNYPTSTFASLGYDFSQQNTPLRIDISATPFYDPSNTTEWVGITIGSETPAFVLDEPFSIILRTNGQYDSREYSSDLGSGTWGSAITGSGSYYPFSIVLTNSAGTGSAFGGSSSVVELFAGDNLVQTFDLPTPLSDDEGYIGFQSTSSGGDSEIQSVKVSAVPEPSTWAMLSVAGGLLLTFYRRAKA